MGHPAEDEGKDQGGQQRLDQIPEGAQDGLLVQGDKIPFYEVEQQVPVMPEFLQVEVEPTAARAG